MQTNSLTSPETIWVMPSLGPSLLPAPDVTWLSDFSGTVPPSYHSPSWGILPPVCLLLCLYTPSNFKCSGLSWCGSVNARLWEWRELLSYNHWPHSPPKPLGSCGYLSRAQAPSYQPTKSHYHQFLYILCNLWLPNFISSGILFAVYFFFRRSVGCMSKQVQLPPILPPSSALLQSYNSCSWSIFLLCS